MNNEKMNEIMNNDEIDRLCMESDADYEFLRQDMLDMYRMRVSGTMHRFPACVPFDSVSYAYEAMSRLKAKAALLDSDDDEEEYAEDDEEEDEDEYDPKLTLCRLNKEAAILRSSLRADAEAVAVAVSGLEIPVLRRANTYIGDGLTNGNPCGDRLFGEPVADLVADIDFADYPFEWDINMWLDEVNL